MENNTEVKELAEFLAMDIGSQDQVNCEQIADLVIRLGYRRHESTCIGIFKSIPSTHQKDKE